MNKRELATHMQEIDLNMFLEQFLFKALADQYCKEIRYKLQKIVVDNEHYNLDRFYDLPEKVDYIHLMNYKTNQSVCEQLAQRLWLENPDLYHRSIEIAHELEQKKGTKNVFAVSFQAEQSISSNTNDNPNILFYRTSLLLNQYGININQVLKNSKEDAEKMEISIKDALSQVSNLNHHEVILDAFEFELSKGQFIGNLPSIYELTTYHNQHLRKLNEFLKMSINLWNKLFVRKAKYYHIIESGWNWVENNEFHRNSNLNVYLDNLNMEISYYGVILYLYLDQKVIKEHLLDTLSILILDSIDGKVVIETLSESIIAIFEQHNSTYTPNELNLMIQNRLISLLYKGALIIEP